jgi:hypothetical protein
MDSLHPMKELLSHVPHGTQVILPVDGGRSPGGATTAWAAINPA